VPRIAKELVEAQAAAMGVEPPSGKRAAVLAETVGTLIQAVDEAAAGVTLEWEPARFLTAADETAAR